MLGNNMFAYCGNDPINFADAAGTRREYVRDLGAGVGTVCANYVSSVDDIESFEDFLRHMARPRKDGNTFSAGLALGTSYPGGLAGESYVLAVDTSHNYAFQQTSSLGASSGLGGSVGLVMTYTNATNVHDLEGSSISYGGTYAWGGGLSFEFFTFSPKSNPNSTCWGVNIIISLGGEAEVHMAENYTTSTDSWNPFDALREAIYG